MAYTTFNDINEDENIFSLQEANTSDRYKVAYILRSKGNYFLYTLCDNDFLYEIEPRDVNVGQSKKIYNFLCKNKIDLFANCKIMMTAKKKSRKKKFTICCLNQYNKLEKTDLFLKKNLNSWILQDDIYDYMGIIYNDNLTLRVKDGPDKIVTIIPKDYETNYNISKIRIKRPENDIVSFYFNENNINLDIIKNKKAEWRESIDSWAMPFQFPGGLGSIKNTVMTNYDDERIVETLKIDNNIMAIVYKKPFSLIHAFSFGLSKFCKN